ncbi:unnamed protein product [Adineta steineri]|uniref:Arrestin C-terminal-like domain-containing protein n=1 Tax=Adineta steineri TaxID=433720 RepID=A0A814D252_9BILA|nr:unnamed protein product [Adineta steineri]CAF1093934.1 unnamed protein product [Adineta steineri]
MGNGNISQGLIHLNQTKTCYLTGDTISGTVNLNLIQAKRQVEKIYIELIGEIGYTGTKYTWERAALPTATTAYHHPKFYKDTIILTILNVEREISYWPFQFQLPDYLPPTLNKLPNYPHVKYYLRVRIYRKGSIVINKVIKYVTKIYPRVNLLKNLEWLKPIHNTYIDNNVILYVTLNKSGYVPGEVIYMTLQIENPLKALIQRIDFSIIKNHVIGRYICKDTILLTDGCKCKDTIFKITLPKILNLKDEQIQEVFDVIIPSLLLPPSYVSHEEILKNVYIDISYKLELAIKIQGIFNDFYVDIPITLGTESNPNFNQQQIFNPMVIPDYSMFNDDDLPPEYDSTVQNLERLSVQD